MPNRVRFSTISPRLHCGQVTPVLLGEPRAPDESAVPTESDLQAARRTPPLLYAPRALLVEVLDVALELLLGALEVLGEWHPELLQYARAFRLTLGDLVELLLHLGREVHVDDLGEVLDELVGDDLGDVLGVETAILQPDVSTVLDRRDDRRVRRRAPDAELLERLHERRLGVSGRRLREVLLG